MAPRTLGPAEGHGSTAETQCRNRQHAAAAHAKLLRRTPTVAADGRPALASLPAGGCTLRHAITSANSPPLVREQKAQASMCWNGQSW